MTGNFERCEEQRLALQASLDGQKKQAERNRLGQYATPTILARSILDYGLSLLSDNDPVCFLDPAVGTGSFCSALMAISNLRHRKVMSARGFEIDPHYGNPAVAFWSNSSIKIELGDFTRQMIPRDEASRANLLICNPPYVRHHHIEVAEKLRLRNLAKLIANVNLTGLAGLYCYFMTLAHGWMREGGIAGWLVPSEFMDVNYGRGLKEYLLRDVTLLHIHRFDPADVQFNDALVSSAVVWFRKEKPGKDHLVTFSYGGTLHDPAMTKSIGAADLKRVDKWTQFPRSNAVAKHKGCTLGDLFNIKRGLATGDNGFFILDEEKVKNLSLPAQFLKPILPSSRYLKTDIVEADAAGVPLLDKKLFLLDCSLPEDEVRQKYPKLWDYLQTGIDTVASGYLCRSRKLWYAQEERQAAPIVCTYMGRSGRNNKPFRFILNKSHAAATNVYLMLYPKPRLKKHFEERPDSVRVLWQALNDIASDTLAGNGRVYGGGLHKLEPKELANVPANELVALIGLGDDAKEIQMGLF